MRYIALTIVLIAVGWSRAAAQTAPPSPAPSAAPAPAASPLTWTSYITPYAWVPNINGQLNFQHPAPGAAPNGGTSNVNVHVGPSNYLSNLNFVAMLAFYAKRGDLSLAADYMYLNMSSTKAFVASVIDPNGNTETPVNVSTNTHLRGTIATAEAGFSLTSNDISPVEFVGGVRYLGTKASADWNFAAPLAGLDQAGSASRDLYTWDPVVGFRGKIGLNPEWYLPYYIDYGAGASNTTHQEFVGIGYSQHWGDIVLINRWLQYNFTNPNINSIQLVGPALGVRIRL